MRSGVSKTYRCLLFWVVGVVVLVDSMRMIMVVAVVVAMIVRVGMGMIMGGRMVRIRGRSLMG